MSQDSPSRSSRITTRVIASLLLSAAIGSLVLAVPSLRGVENQIERMHLGWVAAAIALELASCLGFVVIFRLFFDELPSGTARELAWAEEGSGALLPGGGVGGLAIGAWFLRRAGMSKGSIVDRSSALFFLTSAVNVAALIGAGALLATGGAGGPDDLLHAWVPVLGGVVALVGVLSIPRVIGRESRREWPAWLVELAAGISRARASVLRPNWRVLGAVAYLGFDVAALGATFAAAGRPIAAAPLVLGYLIGYLANLIPIPGAFGVLEGGLAATLIAYGAPATQATAAVIIYHAIAFWIPSLGGLAGYALLRRRLAPALNETNPRPVPVRSLGLVPETAPAYCAAGGMARPR